MFDYEINEMKDKCKGQVLNKIVNRSSMNQHLKDCKILIDVFENNFENLSDENNYIRNKMINQPFRYCV